MVADLITSHRLTINDVYYMLRTGVLDEDARIELLDGVLVDMAPIGHRHYIAVGQLDKLLRQPNGEQISLSTQGPLQLSVDTVLQPDIVVLSGDLQDYPDLPMPSDVLLVVEVSDTTYRKDRRVKIPLYARTGIPEAWIVNLASNFIEVFRDPGPNGYTSAIRLTRNEPLSPLLLPHIRLTLADLLPRRPSSRSR